MNDADGHPLFDGAHVSLLKEIRMERLFAGYDDALLGKPTPRDLVIGDVGMVVEMTYVPDPVAIVEFKHNGRTFWRGGLHADEIRRHGA
jgi:hypothetical protein